MYVLSLSFKNYRNPKNKREVCTWPLLHMLCLYKKRKIITSKIDETID